MLIAASTVSTGFAAAKPAATDVRFGMQDQATRFVVELSEPVGFQIFTLPDPYRVVIDMSEVAWRLSGETANVGRGVVSGFRYGLFRPGTTRIVLDVNKPVRVKRSFLLPPSGDQGHRFVLDLEPVTPATFDDEARLTAIETPASALEKPPEKPSQTSSVEKSAGFSPDMQVRKPPVPDMGKAAARVGPRVVVIDPGHGGVDPGAIGHGGTREKAIALAAALEIKEQLEATGRYKAIMTRDRDIFIRLRDRVALARDAGADLFISIHADSIGSAKVKGASVYTLSENASDKEAEKLAAKENKADIIAGVNLAQENPEVTDILIDLAQRESMNEGARFANMLIGELRRATGTLQKSHRFAGFAVLKAPDVPSVLLEMGYLSNPTEEKNLKSKAHRRKLAVAIVQAIDRYFAHHDQLSRS
ncbi:MAG: N-acetylmuramoyl-L-alanine amidase [Rhodospirillaceae bacterium]|nr:N-acetylmuramoyl-L-alanine amidase [Rhodospirillaceae bacterium]MBT6116947.1 N-acetylmuramoyl-L-alanine amidase [Rhodospirillaceae bacterium]